MAEPPGGDPLVFPLGHYVGASFASGGPDPDFHVVRVGWKIHKLPGNDQFPIWALAHGMPADDAADAPPWTRGTVEGAARLRGISNVAGVLGGLLEQGLLAEVVAGTPNAVDFARACRTRSLLVGVGNSAGDPLRYGISASRATPPVRVDAVAYELWKWGHACDNLWHACKVLAAVGGPDLADPAQVLDRCLSSIQLLIAGGAVYLDAARVDTLERAG